MKKEKCKFWKKCKLYRKKSRPCNDDGGFYGSRYAGCWNRLEKLEK